MAANTATLADPADGHFDDWFEIFNPNSVAVDLTGYTLTDNLTNTTALWPIPAGTRIVACGFLLVWADDDTNQNTNSTDLHANMFLYDSDFFLGQAIVELPAPPKLCRICDKVSEGLGRVRGGDLAFERGFLLRYARDAN